jgi:uncharacterized protein (TIGR02611 family)
VDGTLSAVRSIWQGGSQALALTRRIAVGVVGGAITIAGIVLCFIPGPGLLLILVGLSILATEFEWARAARAWVQRKIHSVRRRMDMSRRPKQRQLH